MSTSNLHRTAVKVSASTDRILFVHVPKCGGSSVISALTKTFGTEGEEKKNEVFGLDAISSRIAADVCNLEMHNLRNALLAYQLTLKKAQLVHGHFPLSQEVIEAYSSSWRFITMLREPKERVLSEYYYNRYKPDRDHFGTDLNLAQWLDTTDALAAASKFVQYFSGDLINAAYIIESCHKPKTLETHIVQALRNLDNFDIVGRLDKSKEFERAIHERFHRRIELPGENKSPNSDYPKIDEQPLDIQKRIENICASDSMVYEWFWDKRNT